MAEMHRYTDDLDETLADLQKRIDEAAKIEECHSKGCPLFGILEALSLDAKEQLMSIDPTDTVGVIQCQQSAKLFKAILLALRNKLSAAQVAEDKLREAEQEE